MNFHDTLSCTAFKLIGSFKLTGYLRYLLIEAEPTFWGYSAIQKQTLKFLMSYNTCNQKKKNKNKVVVKTELKKPSPSFTKNDKTCILQTPRSVIKSSPAPVLLFHF